MGRDKEERLKQEEKAAENAIRAGHRCAVCSAALTTNAERADGLCAYHRHTADKD